MNKMNLFVLMLKPVWGRMAFGIILSFLAIVCNVGLIACAAFLITTAALHVSIAELSLSVVGVRFFGISRAVLRYAERYFSHSATFDILSRMRLYFYERLEKVVPEKTWQYQKSDLFNVVVTDIEYLRDFYLRVLSPVIVAVLVLVLGLSTLWLFDLQLAIVLLVSFLLIGIFIPKIVGFFNSETSDNIDKLNLSLQAKLLDGIKGIAEVIYFKRANYFVDGLTEIIYKTFSVEKKYVFTNAFIASFSNLIMNLAVLGVLSFGIFMLEQGQINGVMLAVLVLGVQSSFEAILPLAQAWNYYDNSKIALDRLTEITQIEVAVSAKEIESKEAIFADKIELENVSFGYQNEMILHDISFCLEKGKRTAVVGESGAGKTTIVNLLLGFNEGQSGQILLDGALYSNIDKQKIRGLFNVVSQESHIFNASLRDNIMLANPEATSEKIAEAVEISKLAEFANDLPNGLDTILSHGGKTLSRGQAQRIFLARALIKEAPIFIFDEPLVGLDMITGQQVLEDIKRITLNKTTLFITHRLVGLEDMDEILVMDHGDIVERGTWAELIEKKGLFYNMWQLEQDSLFYM